MFLEEVFLVYLDGNFVGLCEDEDLVVDIAQDHINGIDILLDDDMPDRLEYHRIGINRWYFYDQYNCADRLSKDNIMCYGYYQTKDCVQKMNQLTLEKERAEAKLRAMTL